MSEDNSQDLQEKKEIFIKDDDEEDSISEHSSKRLPKKEKKIKKKVKETTDLQAMMREMMAKELAVQQKAFQAELDILRANEKDLRAALAQK